jgi:uncharacterized protein YbjT (DUF2867 family)
LRETCIVEGNLLDIDSLRSALDRIDVAYYLISSLHAGERNIQDQEQRAAENFGRAARSAGVRRIIYLGDIRKGTEPTTELLGRQMDVADSLRRGGVPLTEFRIGVLIGSGSLSFEVIRNLTERSPILIATKWVRTKTRPLALRNVLQYLVGALDVEESSDKTIELAGMEELTLAQMVRVYAKERGLRRFQVSVPLSIPGLSAWWIGLLTPLSVPIARRTVEWLSYDTRVDDGLAQRLFNVRLITFADAVRRALRRFADDNVDSTWTDALVTEAHEGARSGELRKKEGLITERVGMRSAAKPDALFDVICSLGGETGWLYANALWRIRGFIDLFSGGTGLRRTRRSYTQLRVGDTIDFWRIEEIEENRLLRLRAEMKVPGRAWLQYELAPATDGTTQVTQTAFYEPRGLAGFVYWYVLYLPHRLIFPGLLRALIKRAERRTSNTK